MEHLLALIARARLIIIREELRQRVREREALERGRR
jgi:hypothetical protein